MSFRPTIPLAGIAGWRLLERTLPAQQAAFDKGSQLQREIADFKAKIAGIASAEQLVADRQLLKVALGAFGLEQDLDKRAFVRKILEEGTDDPRSMANRLTAPAYKKLADAFGFGNAGGARTADPGFADKIAAQYRLNQFEVAVGEVNDDMRLALNFRREIAELAQKPAGGGWYEVLGSKPLRRVFEAAFGLPKEFAAIDIDRQREILADKTRGLFGEGGLAVFKEPAHVERVIDRFLVRAQLEAGPDPNAPGASALALLQSANATGSQGLWNLLAARG
jgi:Protein of unknown function (DUF1217)